MRKRDEPWNRLEQSWVTDYSGNPYEEKDPLTVDMLTPSGIVRELDKSVIGQIRAKQLIATSAHNRLLSLRNKQLGRTGDEYYFEKSNVLLIGNTGCGKTHIIKALSNVVSLPVTVQDATGYTSAGYVGNDVSKCITALAYAATSLFDKKYKDLLAQSKVKEEMIKELIEYGIVYIDEADKVRTSGGPGKDVNGRGVQEAFLRLVEGDTIYVKSDGYTGHIDTTNILFIFGGAFSDLDKIVDQRVNTKSIGFNAELPDKQKRENVLEKANIIDFTKYGMIPELMGRLPTIAVLKEMDLDTMTRIFSEPNQSIMSQVRNEFKSFDIKVAFTKEAVKYIAEEALKLNIGARGLRAVCQQLLLPLYYRLPDTKTKRSGIISKATLLKYKDREDF